MTQVVDASATVEVVTRTPRGARVRRSFGTELVAPELIDAEVVSALARQQRAGELTAAEADTALARFTRLQLTRVSHVVLTDEAWRLRHRIRTTDAFYAVCARLMNAELITTDGRLKRASLPGVLVTL